MKTMLLSTGAKPVHLGVAQTKNVQKTNQAAIAQDLLSGEANAILFTWRNGEYYLHVQPTDWYIKAQQWPGVGGGGLS